MSDSTECLQFIREKAARLEIRITQHAHQEMTEDAIQLDDILHVVSNGRILEDYPNHRRGPRCLLYGADALGRDIHVVYTTSGNALIIIAVYLPPPSKWNRPTERKTKP